MELKKWSNDIVSCDLGDGFYLEKASFQEYCNYYAVYYQHNNANGWFKKSYDIMKSTLDEDDPAFWIVKDNKRIGGVFMSPNELSELFLIPPFTKIEIVMEKLLGILLFWSDDSKDIFLESIIDKRVIEYCEKNKFIVNDSGKWMIRPTEKIEVIWEDKYFVCQPKREDELKIGALLYEAFEENNKIKTSYSLEEYTGWVTEYFDDFLEDDLLNRASTLVYDKKTDELIGVCYISLWQEWPLLSQVAVKPSYQGRGIGSKMIKMALNILKEEYDALRLYVEVGNEAEKVYSSLGFLSGKEIVQLKFND